MTTLSNTPLTDLSLNEDSRPKAPPIGAGQPAPKSNALYTAYKSAMRTARETGSLMPPAHILNAPTKLMKDIGYGAGYSYDHDTEHGFSGQNYFPDGMERQQFYTPKGEGREKAIQERLERWSSLRQITD